MIAYLDLARRGRTAWWCYVLTPVAAVALWVLAIVAVFAAAFVAHLVPADFTQFATDPSHPAYFYGFTGLVFGALAIAFAIAAWAIHGKGFMDIVGPWKWRQFAAGAGLWLVLCAAAAGVDFLVRPSGFRLTLGPQTLALALIATPCLAAQTFCEEFVFRGYATQGLALGLKRPMAAAALSAAIFALFHIPNGVPQAANALVFGFVTALIVMRTTNLAFTYGIHLVNNLFGAVVVVSAGDVLRGSPGIFTQATPGLMWLDVAAVMVAFALVWLLVTRLRPPAAEGPEAVF
jgi:membrane protease YdiL (CAAX protease family)